MKKIEAGGGIICRENSNDETEVVLIKRRGVWDLPKGKRDDGEGIRDCALREVQEEISPGKITEADFVDTTYHEYVESGEQIGKTTYWYLMKTANNDPEFDPQKEEQIEEVRWVVFGEAVHMVAFNNLKTILGKAVEKIKMARN